MGMSVHSLVMYLCGLRKEIHWFTTKIDVLTKVKEAPQRNYTTTKHKGHCYWTSIMLHITRATQLFLSVNTSLGRHRAGINLAYLSKVSNYLVYLINRTRRILKWFCKIQRGLISYSLKKKNKSLVESLISLFNHTLIRSNRGTSYTWHWVRLQEKKRACISLSRGGGEHIRLRQRRHNQTEQQEVWVGRMGIWASQAPFPHKAHLSGKHRLDTHTHCTLAQHSGINILPLLYLNIGFYLVANTHSPYWFYVPSFQPSYKHLCSSYFSQ